MINEVYHTIGYFLSLTFNTELLWTILPLIIATVVMVIYFEKHRNEEIGWNSHFANSLVLLFVAMNLLRAIYNIDGLGGINFITYAAKTGVTITLLVIGLILAFLNFEHHLPEKIAKPISSPITVNSLAYIAILFIYSGIEEKFINFSPPETNTSITIIVSLIILYILLIIALHIIRIPIRKTFEYLKKLKDHEKIENIQKEKKLLHQEKKEVKKREKKLTQSKQELDKQQKEVSRLRKELRKR